MLLGYKYIAIALVAGAMLAGSFWQGWEMRGDREAAKQAKVVAKHQAMLDEARITANEISAELHAAVSSIQIVNKTIVKEVRRETINNPDYGCIMPDAGYRLWIEANTGATTGNTSKPDNAVPSAPVAR